MYFISTKLLGATLIVVLLFSACTKTGPEGRPGLDGTDGLDGSASCMDCHNSSENLKAIMDQYSNSKHASGANINRNSPECAGCHTSMGFRNYITDGFTETINNPTPVNCRTCHTIHETFTFYDYDLRTALPVDLMQGSTTYDYAKSNLCVNCHQGRSVTPYPEVGGEDITIANARYGPHYATQANIFTGIGPVEIPGSMVYLNSAHTTHVKDGCITCHMSPSTGNWAGGHQMSVKYNTSSGADAYQYTGCLASGCHESSSTVTALINPNRIEIQGLMEELNNTLQSKGLLNASGLIPTPKTMTQLEAAAILNYKFVYGDQSYGAHNYRYVKALIINTIESLQ
jgi:hypothetical protein